jgi:hypothetical protein
VAKLKAMDRADWNRLDLYHNVCASGKWLGTVDEITKHQQIAR